MSFSARFGFIREDRARLRIGYYHPEHPSYGFQQVSGALFDGRADRSRIVRVRIASAGHVSLPSVEDMIADRLGQYAVASKTDRSRLDQARTLFKLAETLDID